MEAAGRDGGRGPSWSYRHHGEEAGSSSYTISGSSRSGTIVSTAYTSSGSASRHSSSISMESALLELDLELRVGTSGIEAVKKDAEFAQQIKKPRKAAEEPLKEMRMKRIEGLVQEFFRGPSENRSILGGGGGMSALERWFSELGVSWVLQLDVEHPTRPRGNNHTWIWINALEKITETIRLTASFFPDHGHGFVGMPGISEEEVESGKQATSLDPVQFGLFFQKAMSKMLVFVDLEFSYFPSIYGVGVAYLQYSPCLDLHDALSKALLGIKLQFHSTPSAQVEKIKNEMVSLLSEKQGRAFEAIWSTLEEIRTGVIKDTQTPQESSDIDWDIHVLMSHINNLLRNESTVTPLVSQAASLGKYVPQTGLGEAPPFISLITEMVFCLEEKLITKSQLFLDKGLSLLFLLNSSNFIRENLNDSLSACAKVVVEIVTRKDELGHYIERYIQVSWAPMLSCLSNHTPLCLGRNHSPLSKFESEFQKTYTTQKLWKVPDPELRKRLRKAVTENIIPGYTKYIEDSKVTNPKFTPQELEEMLQELYEG